MEKDSRDPIILKGLVIPAQWDKNGKIVGLAIACSDEKEYPVLMDNVGRNLMTHMHDVVKITGKAIKIDNLEAIQVKRFAKIARSL